LIRKAKQKYYNNLIEVLNTLGVIQHRLCEDGVD